MGTDWIKTVLLLSNLHNYVPTRRRFVLFLQFVLTHSSCSLSLPWRSACSTHDPKFLSGCTCLWTYCNIYTGQCVCILVPIKMCNRGKWHELSTQSVTKDRSFFLVVLCPLFDQSFYDSSSGYCSLDIQRNSLVSSSICHRQSICLVNVTVLGSFLMMFWLDGSLDFRGRKLRKPGK